MRTRTPITVLAVLATGAVLAVGRGPSVRAGSQERPAGRQQTLPDGPGRTLVESTCARCHGLNVIQNTWGFDQSGWEALIRTMISRPQARLDALTAYLAANFPPKPDIPPAKIVSGQVRLTMRSWNTPSLGSRPHDGLVTRDGRLWWSGTISNAVGYIDPRTNEIRQYVSPTPGAGPQGMVEDDAGNIWYTTINAGLIGKLNPRTGEIVEYDMPKKEQGETHTPYRDQKGNIWFTLRTGHLGRISIATGEVQVVPSPSDPTYPYGLQVDSQGIPWYVDFRQNKLGSINPDTMAITEHVLPNPDTRPRRIAITPDDAIWYTDYPRGYLARFDRKTGTIEEWPSPSGPDSAPYGMTAVGNVIWYTESATRPNTLVRFDPTTEQFQSWPIEIDGLPIQGVVRHMASSPDGKILMVQSRVNAIVLAEVQR